MSAEPLISVLQVSKIYQIGQAEVRALDNATVSISSGEVIGVIGPSGSGKTTFLMIAGLLEPPSFGAVLFRGKTISTPGTKVNHLREFRRQHVGFVFQKPNLIPFLTAAQNVEIALRIGGEARSTAALRARALIEQFGMGARADNLPNQLSGGEQQRVAIARALANRPELILADEPTANLDSARGRQVMETLRRLADAEGVAIVVVTHDTRSMDLFDRRIELSDGRITQAVAG
ncbi:putative ABC transport system ATP-binding protein [Rhizobiales bacterium GAS191]|nr:putative ABC transport system ATP-binding protein [Rhizobiales bacterium GAS113]SEC08684.1 putative ABC transport system ATP-binding protein [Rhizobiales bacterium GAS191]